MKQAVDQVQLKAKMAATAHQTNQAEETTSEIVRKYSFILKVQLKFVAKWGGNSPLVWNYKWAQGVYFNWAQGVYHAHQLPGAFYAARDNQGEYL